MVVPHAVSRLLSNGRKTRGYTLVFNRSGHTRLPTPFQIVGTYPVILSFSKSSNIRLQLRFQTVCKHSGACSFSNFRATGSLTLVFKWSGNTRLHTHSQMAGISLGFTVVFKCPGHTRLHPRFQMVGTPPVIHSFSKRLHTRLHIRFQTI